LGGGGEGGRERERERSTTGAREVPQSGEPAARAAGRAVSQNQHLCFLGSPINMEGEGEGERGAAAAVGARGEGRGGEQKGEKKEITLPAEAFLQTRGEQRGAEMPGDRSALHPRARSARFGYQFLHVTSV
jgi:hypothetical protein